MTIRKTLVVLFLCLAACDLYAVKTVTVPVDFSASGSILISIPKSAKKLIMWRSVVAEPVTLNIKDAKSYTLYPFDLAANAVMFNSMALSSDAAQVRVSYLTGSGVPLKCRLIFEIAK